MKTILTHKNLLIGSALVLMFAGLTIWAIATYKSRIEDSANQYRAKALAAYEAGRQDEALANIKLAIQSSASLLPASSEAVVEAYDMPVYIISPWAILENRCAINPLRY